MQITTITAYALIEANYNKNVCIIFAKKIKTTPDLKNTTQIK